MEPVVFTLEGIDAIAERVVQRSGLSKIFLFYGELGAGKTTLIKSICRHLHVEEYTSSPTFAIVNTYQGSDQTIYHFDLFRLRDVHELEAIGFSEYADSGNYLFIEWPDLALPLLQGYDVVKVTLEAIDSAQRSIIIHQVRL